MTKKSLDEKYSYQIDEHNVVHLFRGEEDCQQLLTNPLLSAIFKIETLEKENAELKCECRRCIHTDCPCILSDYGKDRNGICDHFKDVFDEIVELKNKDCWKSCEYANPKAELIEQHIKDVQNLTKAKKYIGFLLGVVHIKNTYNKEIEEEIAKAEQFLSEVEK